MSKLKRIPRSGRLDGSDNNNALFQKLIANKRWVGKHRRKWVVIVGRRVIGVFATSQGRQTVVAKARKIATRDDRFGIFIAYIPAPKKTYPSLGMNPTHHRQSTY